LVTLSVNWRKENWQALADNDKKSSMISDHVASDLYEAVKWLRSLADEKGEAGEIFKSP